MYSGRYAEFIRSNGRLRNLSVQFTEPNKCHVSFAISGVYNGSSQFKSFHGRAIDFAITKSGDVLIHYIKHPM